MKTTLLLIASFLAFVLAGGPVEVKDSNFDDLVLNNKKPVLIEFYAPWCHYCKALAPVYEKLADTTSDMVIIAKMNGDDPENFNVVSEYGITAYPTVKLFDGVREPVSYDGGALDLEGLRVFLANNGLI